MTDEVFPSLTDLSAALFRFIGTAATDYAVMLNGEWGSGKTYFWRNSIEKILKERKKKVLYVSLYGVTSAAEIDWRILEELSPFLGKTGWLGSVATKWSMRRYGIDPDMLYYRSSLKGYVLCFDDLERVTCPKPVVLGCLNRLVEHDGLKVILIANESGIPQEDEYWVAKEKMIGRTYRFKMSTAQAVETVLAGLAKDSVEASNLKLLNEETTFCVKASKNTNLRSIRAAVDVCIFLLESTDKQYEEQESLRRSLVRLTAGLCLANKANPHGALSLKDLFIDREALRWMIVATERENASGKMSPKDVAIKEFIDIYFDGDLDKVPLLPSAYRYVIDGLFDINQFAEELGTQAAMLQPKVISPEERFLTDLWSLPENEIKSVAAKVVQQVENGERRSPTFLYRALSTLIFAAEKGILDDSPESLAALFTATLEELSASEKLDHTEMESPDFLYGTGAEENEHVKRFLIRLGEISKQHLEQLAATDVDQLFLALKMNPRRFIALITDGDDPKNVAYKPIFNKYPIEQIKNFMLRLSAKDMILMARALSRRYGRVSNIRDVLGAEAESLKALSELLRQVSEPSGLKRAAMEQLITQIDHAVLRLSPDSQK